MTDLDLDSIRRRHDEDHEHDGGCDTLDLLAEVERLRAAATHEVAAQYGGKFDRWYAAEKAKWQAEALGEFERRIEAFIRHGRAVPSDVTTYSREDVHNDLRNLMHGLYADRIERGE